MVSPVKKPKEVFLSHSSADEKLARRIAETLKSAFGLRVWFSPSNLRGAEAWHDEIGKALGRCDWFVVLLTPSAVRSPWVKRELVYALSELRYEGRIVPVKIKTCELDLLSWVLRTIEQIDCTRSAAHAAEEIAGVWGLTPKSLKRGKGAQSKTS